MQQYLRLSWHSQEGDAHITREHDGWPNGTGGVQASTSVLAACTQGGWSLGPWQTRMRFVCEDYRCSSMLPGKHAGVPEMAAA